MSRFTDFDETLAQNRIYSKNTDYATNTAKNSFHEYLEERKILIVDFVSASTSEQDEILSTFFGTIRKKW